MAGLFSMTRLLQRIATPAFIQRGNKMLCMSRTQVNSIASWNIRKYSSNGSEDIPRENIPISRFPVPELDTLPADIQERMETIEEKSGFMPNVFKILAHRPDEFRAFFSYYDALMEKETGSLTKAEKEMIVVVTSSFNDCLYCVVAHSALHRIYSRNRYVADQVAVNWELADLTPREFAIVKYAMDVCKCEPITDESIDSLEKHGVSKEDAWDIGAIAAFFALSNRMAHVAGMRPNEEFYAMGRVKFEKKE